MLKDEQIQIFKQISSKNENLCEQSKTELELLFFFKFNILP